MAVDLSTSITSPTGFTLDNGTLAGKGTVAQAAALLGMRAVGSSLALSEANSSLRGAAPLTGGSMTTLAATAGRLYMVPVCFGVTTVTEIGFVVTTAGGASKKARVGIYGLRSGSMAPGALLVDGGELAIDSTGHKAASISQAVVQGALYWLALLSDTVAPTIKASASSQGWPLGVDTGTATASGTYGTHIYRTVTYGALPSDESSQTAYTYSGGTGPILLWK